MKNKALFGVIGLVVIACGALVTFAAWKILKRPHGGVGIAGRISRDAAIVVMADFRQVRAWQPATSLHDALVHPAEGATETQREFAQRYQEIVQNCGFEPWQKVDGVTVGVDRAVVEGRDQSAVAAFIDGSYTQAEADRCLRFIASKDHRTLASSQVGRHAVLTPLREGEQPTGHSNQLTILPGTTLVTESSYTQRALAVLDGESPALASDSPLTTMTTRLGPGVFLAASADLAELRSRQQRTIDGFIDDLVRANPDSPDLALLRQARTGGASLAVINGSLAAMVRVEEPSATNAQSLVRAVDAVIQRHRGEFQSALRDARQSQQFLRLTVGSLPGMAERFQRVDEGAAVLEALINQIATRAEGNDAVVSLTATQAQVTSIQQGVRAFGEIMSEASRNNPLGGILGGRRNGAESGAPSLDLPIPAVPGLTPPLQAPTL